MIEEIGSDMKTATLIGLAQGGWIIPVMRKKGWKDNRRRQ